MTSASARTAANVVLVSTGVAAAYVVWTTPPLRRLAWRLGASVPAYLLDQARRAWMESAQSA